MPLSGETLAGRTVILSPGGKEVNQAYAVGNIGGKVSKIGAVADDSFGVMLKNNLNNVDIDTGGIAAVKGETTGQAYI